MSRRAASMDRTSGKAMVASLRAVCRVTSIVMALLLLAMVVVMNALVVTRYLFSYSAPWTEEISRYAMIWMVMLGAGVLTLFDDHIALHLLVDKLPRRARPWQRLLVQMCILASALLIVWEGVRFAVGMKTVMSTALGTSMFYAAVSVPIGALLIAFFAAIRVAIEAADIAGARPPAIPDQFEFMDNSFKPVADTPGPASHHGPQ